MTKLKLLGDVPKRDLAGKRVLFRADFDVPMANHIALNDFRMRATMPSMNYLSAAGAKILILTKRGHLAVKETEALSTSALMPHLEKLIGQKIEFIPDISALKFFSETRSASQFFLFENLRFWPEEEENSEDFAKKFAASADLYVSDNFGTAHRSHASVISIPKFLPSYAGFLLEKEIIALEKALENPVRPITAIMGGSKLETKLPLIKKFIDAGDAVLLGGKIAASVLRGKGIGAGSKKCVEETANLIKNLNLQSANLYLPTDGLLATDLNSSRIRAAAAEDMSSDECMFDIGPKTIGMFSGIIQKAATVIWNGPMGVAEQERFQQGTLAIAKTIRKNRAAYKIVGGGDLIGALERQKLLSGFDHVSTGGGAMLKFLAGDKLPGVTALEKNI